MIFDSNLFPQVWIIFFGCPLVGANRSCGLLELPLHVVVHAVASAISSARFNNRKNPRSIDTIVIHLGNADYSHYRNRTLSHIVVNRSYCPSLSN